MWFKTFCSKKTISHASIADPSCSRDRDGGDQFFYLPDLEYGPADWDRVHAFSVATTYAIPFAQNNRWLGGWQINQTTIIQSGSVQLLLAHSFS